MQVVKNKDCWIWTKELLDATHGRNYLGMCIAVLSVEVLFCSKFCFATKKSLNENR